MKKGIIFLMLVFLTSCGSVSKKKPLSRVEKVPENRFVKAFEKANKQFEREHKNKYPWHH